MPDYRVEAEFNEGGMECTTTWQETLPKAINHLLNLRSRKTIKRGIVWVKEPNDGKWFKLVGGDKKP
jgi:hypothetical protein